MTTLYESPLSVPVAVLLALVAAWLATRGARRMAAGLRDAVALELVWGIRDVIFAVVTILFAVATLTASTGFAIFGAIILAEELYETGLLVLLIRLGDRKPVASGRGRIHAVVGLLE